MTNGEFLHIIWHHTSVTPEEKEFIRNNPVMAARYAIDVLYGRWIEAEDVIRSNEQAWKDYLARLRGKAYKYRSKDKWDWILTKLDSNLVHVLNILQMSKVMQDYICKNRPDLIGEIQSLHPIIKEKYKNEFNLSGVEI
jgi:hypothetical protein